MTDATPEQIVAFFSRGQMSDIVERLREELADVRADAALLREQVASLRAALRAMSEFRRRE